MLKRIRIPSRWTGGEGVADFQLGLGSCGKTVITLDASVTDHGVTITQVTDDGEAKRFHYLNKHITGRIEETYA